MSKLIDTSRALRKKLRDQRSHPMLFASPGLRAALSEVDLLLLEVEDLDDRVALLEIAAGTHLVGERRKDASS